ncbi:MAG: hypothetical protein KatS3mg021_2820 [Fimbriimonadales bacterium]|nr:MAG: hypothetical protein KatS3mg021_2820 [Fimbriimonadales bacterium]
MLSTAATPQSDARALTPASTNPSETTTHGVVKEGTLRKGWVMVLIPRSCRRRSIRVRARASASEVAGRAPMV